MKCDICRKKKATHECKDCGAIYCEECAILYDNICDCMMPNIVEIKINNKKENNKNE